MIFFLLYTSIKVKKNKSVKKLNQLTHRIYFFLCKIIIFSVTIASHEIAISFAIKKWGPPNFLEPSLSGRPYAVSAAFVSAINKVGYEFKS